MFLDHLVVELSNFLLKLPCLQVNQVICSFVLGECQSIFKLLHFLLLILPYFGLSQLSINPSPPLHTVFIPFRPAPRGNSVEARKWKDCLPFLIQDVIAERLELTSYDQALIHLVSKDPSRRNI
jgi:hypothetical protein